MWGKADNCDDLWSGCSEIVSQLNGETQLQNGVNGFIAIG